MESTGSRERKLQELAEKYRGGQLTRRELLRLGGLVVGGSALTSFISACAPASPEPTAVEEPTTAPTVPAEPTTPPPTEAAPEPTPTQPPAEPTPVPEEGPKMGGVLQVAFVAEPPVLDPHVTYTQVTENIASHFGEGLFGRGSKYDGKLQLAESYEVSDDAKTHTFFLRQGVPFHNGKELTSADAVASTKRWLALNPNAQVISKLVDEVKVLDKYSMSIECLEPVGVMPTFLAQLSTIIYPEEVVEAAGDLPVEEHIGTGPYKFEEYQPDRFISLTRFDDYASRSDEPDGFAGRKTAYLDEIRFLAVPEPAVRFDGIMTGEYHFSETMPSDNYEDLVADPDVLPLVVKPFFYALAVFNMKKGMFTDINMRRAVQKTLDMEALGQAAFGSPDFYRLGPSFSAPETAWFTEAGKEYYNNVDLDEARALLEEAGYNGETVRWISSKDYWWLYGMGLTCQNQLAEIGVNVDLQVTDWATLVSRVANPDEFEMYVTGYLSAQHPVLNPSYNPELSPWWENEKRDQLLEELFAETDEKEAMKLIEEMQLMIYEDAAVLRICDHFVLRAQRTSLRDYISGPDIYFWNSWLAE